MTDPITRPTKPARWASDPDVGLPGAIEPPEGKKDDGWANGEAPAAGHVNWMFQQQAHWLRYLDSDATSMEANALSNRVTVSPSGVDQLEAFAINPDTGTVIAVGDNGALKRTTDFGATWTAPASGSSGKFYCALYGGGKFVIAGSSTTIKYSADDGVTWNDAPVAGGSNFYAIAYDGTSYVVCGDNGGDPPPAVPAAYRSTDAVTWVAATGLSGHPGADGVRLTSIVHHGGTFVMGDRTAMARVFRSVDSGATWAAQDLSAVVPELRVHDVTYSPSLGFIAVGSHGSGELESWVVTSPDGITWAVYWHSATNALAFRVRSTEGACYLFARSKGARVLTQDAREILQVTGLGTVEASTGRVALLDSATPMASAFFFAGDAPTYVGAVFRSLIWSPP